jgi:hypothetical protein
MPHKTTFEQILLAFTGATLVQTTVIGGLNFSVADFSILLLAIYYLKQRRIYLPLGLWISFSLIFLLRSGVSLFYLPQLAPGASLSWLPSVIKYGSIALYGLVGYNIAVNHPAGWQTLLKWFLGANLVVGALGIILISLNLSHSVPLLFTAYRYRGLMNDPNYFSWLQLMSLPLVPLWLHKAWQRWLCSTCLIIATLLSGSKSSFLALLVIVSCYLGYRLIKALPRFTIHTLVITGLTLSVIGLGVYLGRAQLATWLGWVADSNESFTRLGSIFTSDNPLSNSGSGRTAAWTHAVGLLEQTNGLGIGFADYGALAERLFASPVIAHNTFLQIAVEWGLFFSCLFFGYFAWQLIRGLFSKVPLSRSLTLMLAIGLIYFLSISLNNSRVFWLFFAGWLVTLQQTQPTRQPAPLLYRPYAFGGGD